MKGVLTEGGGGGGAGGLDCFLLKSWQPAKPSGRRISAMVQGVLEQIIIGLSSYFGQALNSRGQHSIGNNIVHG
jgi:hypothetical protein